MTFREKVSKIVHLIFKDSEDDEGRESDRLKNKILAEKKRAVKDLKRTNDTLQVMVEKGEFTVRVIRNNNHK